MAPPPADDKLYTTNHPGSKTRPAKQETNMNSSIGNTVPAVWKRIRIQYVSLACGLALASAIAVSLDASPLPRTGSGSGSAAPSTRISVPVKPAAALYIVGSEDEAAVLELARRERGFDWGSWESLAIARSEQEAASVQQDIDPQVVVHDLRGKLGVSGPGSESRAAEPAITSALEQAIIAGAASGEAALYGFAP
jgi:hypothetical protein